MSLPLDPKERLDRFREILRHLGNRLLTGVLVAVPLVVTAWVLLLAYRFVDGITRPFYAAIGFKGVPGLGFVTTIILLILLGFMATHVLGRRIIEAIELLILRIPLMAQLYTAVKQALESFKNMKANAPFKRVVYVAYPSEGCFLVGFVTGQIWDEALGHEMTSVFLPTSPNPLTGFVVAIPSEKVIESGLSLEQATKIIMSAGLVAPHRPVPPFETGIPVSASHESLRQTP
jgi:uncharacterized membrane protein